nr:MAG: RNA-dependent RNA polymerase [Mitovirus sp.]
MRNLKNNLFLKVSRVIVWLCLGITTQSSVPVHLLQKLCDHLHRISSDRGIYFAIAYCKASRGNLMNYLSGNPLRNPIAKCTGDGIPICLGALIPSVRKRSYLVIAMIFTVLFSTRALKSGKSPDLTSVTQPFNGKSTDIVKYGGDFWKALGYRPSVHRTPKVLLAKLNSYRVSAGPSGHALNTSLVDAKNIPEGMISLLRTLGGPRVSNLIASYYRHPIVLSFWESMKVGDTKVKDLGLIRRISTFKDKEDKYRVIGILDYWSQICLEPLHTYLLNALRKIKQDCTLDQGKHRLLMRDKLSGNSYHSIDLTAATDRFPIRVISDLLRCQLPGDYVDAWEKVMVETPFDYQGNKFIYSVGNPMGAYSSFNSFALTHHYLIYHCCRELGIRWKTLPYALLGDDIVIGNDKVAGMYKEIITDLGVEFSLAKTHTSKNFYEFAKRIYLDDHEITPFPVSALAESHKSFGMMTVLLLETLQKGWVFDDIPSSVAKFYGVVMNRSSSYQCRIKERSWQFEGVLRTVQGTLPANEFLNSLIRKKGYPLPLLSEDVCKNIYSNAAVEAFVNSSILSQISKGLLDVPLSEVGIRITSLWDKYKSSLIKSGNFPNDLVSFLPSDLPIVFAFKAVQRQFDELEERLRHLDSTGSDWSYYMRQFSLPKSDKSILGKENYVLTRSINQFYTLLEERLVTLVYYPQLLEM